MNQQLIDYIKKLREAGQTDEQIKENLLKAGWKKESIARAFIPAPPKPPSRKMHSSKMQQLHPKAFWLFLFDGIGSPLIILFFMALISSPIAALVSESALPILGLMIFGVLIFGYYEWSRLEYKFYKYTLDEDAFKKELGVIYKKYVTIPYDRIQNIDIYRGILHRILGLSDLHIQTAGGVSMGYQRSKYGIFSEANLPGLSHKDAEVLRDELLRRMKLSKTKLGR